MLLLCACAGSDLMGADTPELFLEALASASVEEWIESMAIEGNPFQEDSVRALIESLQDLSVEPGGMVLEDFEGGYQAVFANSRWAWRFPDGRIVSITGSSVVEWRPGGYRWVTVPVFTGGGAEVGPREKLCMGVITMASIFLVMVFAIWYAKRRYG